MRWRSILSKYLIIMFNNFFGRRKQLLTQTSDTNVTYKKGFVIPYHKIAADVMTFLVILFVEPSKFSSGISGFFHLPYTRSFYRLTGTSRVKSFSSWQTVFSITWMLLSNLSPRQPVPFSLLFRVLSLIYGALKRKKC